MNRHASMNRIFRLVWNESLACYVPAAETARGRGKNSKRKLFAVALSLTAGIAQGGPTGGQVTAGSGTINQSGASTTIQQSTQDLSVNWRTFNIGSQETVNFVQPNSAAIAVNRILDPNGSVILGHLNANGQVYLINPNGVLFGKGAEVNVGGLVASALEVNDSTLSASSKSFSGSGSGSIINEGAITANGGAVALLGNHVANTGLISAQLGTVALGAGSAATLRFDGTRLVSMQVDQSVLNSFASNGGLIRADGGQVLLTAGAQKSLLASVVNNTGVIEARTIENHEGTITLLGGMSSGTVNVNGTLDASAPNGGNGGLVETSAAHVQIADGATITTAAAMGLNGTWTIDPTDFTIASGAAPQSTSGIGATTLQNELTTTNVSIATSAAGSQNGDINLDAPISWSTNTLTLTAANNINVNAVMTLSGSAKVDFEPGTGTLLMGFAPSGAFAGRVDISSNAANALTISGHLYTVVNTLGNAGDATSAPATPTLQAMAATSNLGGHFALGSNIDASPTANWNGGAGFTPIGDYNNGFTGIFDGLGHTVSNLKVNRGSSYGIGLFGVGAAGSLIRNIATVNGMFTGYGDSGGIVGASYGTILNVYANDVVSSADYNTGGVVGDNFGTVNRSHGTGNISGYGNVGGLAGKSHPGATISNSYATGSVTGGPVVDGDFGGLVGYNLGQISSSFATGSVSAATYSVGGLVGGNYGPQGLIANSYSIGHVSAQNYVGGLVGRNYGGGSINTSFSSGAVSGTSDVGGLVGRNDSTTSNSFWNTTLSGQNLGVGAGSATGVHGMTTTQMMTATNFTSANAANGNVNPNWDFANTWTIYNGQTTPLLQAFMTPLTASANITRTYDGTVFAPTIGNLTFSILPDTSHLFGTVSVTGSAAGAANAGTYAFTPGGLYSDQLGYMISYAAGSLTINPATLTVVGTSVLGRTYDGTTNATLTGGTLAGLFGSDSVTLTQAGVFASKNVGTGIAVNANDSLSGVSASNYVIVEPTGLTGTITPASLTVSGTAVGNKVYDGNTTASLNGGLLVGVFGGDSVTLAQSGSFVSKNAGTGIAVNANDSLSGASAFNYVIVEPTGLTGTITPASLTVSGTTVGNKVYDGTNAALLSGGSLVGVFGGDSITLNQSGTFASASVGTGIAVTATDSLSGPGAGNYLIVEPTGLSGSIQPAPANSAGSNAGSSGSSPGSNGPSAGPSAGPGAGPSVGPSPGSDDLIVVAENARTQIVENFIYPQLGANPQVIDPSPTIAPLATADTAGEAAGDSHKAVAVNVSMKIGASGTLNIENGGLRLPSNLVVGNE